MLYALVTVEGEIQRYQDFSAPPAALAAAKGLRWMPVLDSRPDGATGAPVVRVRGETVTRVWAAPAPEQFAAALKQQVAAAVQAHLDAKVRARGYESVHTCVTYADEPSVPRFAEEARAVRAWRSAVWAACYAALDAVLSGERGALTPDEMVSELPELVWPD